MFDSTFIMANHPSGVCVRALSQNLEGVEEEVEGALVAVLARCQWEACLVEECLNFVQ